LVWPISGGSSALELELGPPLALELVPDPDPVAEPDPLPESVSVHPAASGVVSVAVAGVPGSLQLIPAVGPPKAYPGFVPA
jgi:hypothetical protein